MWNAPSPAAHASETTYTPSGQYEARKCMSWKVRERIRRPKNNTIVEAVDKWNGIQTRLTRGGRSGCRHVAITMRNVRRPKSFWGERILYYTVRVCASSLHTEGRKTFLRMVSGFTASEGLGISRTPLDSCSGGFWFPRCERY